MIINKLKNYLITITFLLLYRISVIDALPPSQLQRRDATNIDELRFRYLQLEQALWEIMPSGLDHNFILQQIHKTHKTFLMENFDERGIELSLFDRPQLLLYDDISHINITIKNIKERYLQRSYDSVTEREMIEFSRNGINFTQKINRIFNLTNSQEFFQGMINKYGTNQCNKNASIVISNNQLLFNYYNDISAAHLKAYLIVQLSYMLYTAYGFGDYKYISNQLRINFKQQCISIQSHVQPLMRSAGREVWMCDPISYKGNYEEVTRLVQGYIDNEVNLNTKNNCKKTCADYTMTQNYLCYNGTFCHAEENPPQPVEYLKCNGTILNCEFIGSDMDVCLSEPYQYYTTNRRYEYVKYDNGRTLGTEKLCSKQTTRVESWRRWLVQCSQCFCYCDEPSPMSDRYFSLRDVVSNIYQNMVITGVSIRKYNQVFHLKISERKLWKYGQVNITHPSWMSWKHGNYFKINDYGIQEGIDYHKLSWQNRSINLDMVEAPAGFLMTGVRFQIFEGHLNVEIRVTQFDYITGELVNKDKSFWMSSRNKRLDRSPITLLHPDISIKSPHKSIPDKEERKFINFQPTDLDADAGQTTVPFIDIQSVEPQKPIPLTGFGIHFKGQPFYGGFIAPKLIVYDYSNHIFSPE